MLQCSFKKKYCEIPPPPPKKKRYSIILTNHELRTVWVKHQFDLRLSIYLLLLGQLLREIKIICPTPSCPCLWCLVRVSLTTYNYVDLF